MSDAEFERIHRAMAAWGGAMNAATDCRRADGGFSEATVWRVETTAGPRCLRRWGIGHPSEGRLAWIHEVLRRTSTAGCRFVPAPLLRPGGESFLLLDAHLWEVTPWMPGSPESRRPVAPTRAVAAARALAVFHRAVAEPQSMPTAASPGIVERMAKLERALGGELAAILAAPIPAGWSELSPRLADFARCFARRAAAVQELLRRASVIPVEQVPCIRDIRREHVLFVGNEVSGWVDFGALQRDTPALDVARLLVEFADDDDVLRREMTAAYRDAVEERAATEPMLAGTEPTLVAAFAAGTVLLSPCQWFRWILLEGRDFADRESVLRRIDELLRRLARS